MAALIVKTKYGSVEGIQNGEERPVKQNDHAMDAMRYLCKTVINRRRLAS